MIVHLAKLGPLVLVLLYFLFSVYFEKYNLNFYWTLTKYAGVMR